MILTTGLVALCVSLVKGEGGEEEGGVGEGQEGEERDIKQTKGTYFYCESWASGTCDNFCI